MGIIINNPATATATSGIRENYFKNPAFSIIQGTASGTVPNSLALPTASLGYPGEAEWCIAASGGTPTYAFSTANQTLTLGGAASTTAIRVLQRIESIDANRLASKQVTLSVEISNSLLTSVIWELFRPTTTDTHGTIASPTQTVVASGTWTVTSTLTRYTATVTLPAEVSNGLEVRFRVAAQTSGTWVISRPKLEEGSTATAFVCDDYGVELTKCQRYAQLITNGCQTPVAGNMLYFFPFRVPMLLTPVQTTISNGTAVNASTYGLGAQNAYTHSFGITTTAANGYILAHVSLYSAHIP
jgi:hypothetical protein